ncbi:ABC transporter permease [Tissierella simiarum]
MKRLSELFFTLLFVTLLSFILMRVSKVDPATAYAKRAIGNPTELQIENIRISMGFDKPLPVQYFSWLKGLFQMDLGKSLVSGYSVWDEIWKAFPKTLLIVGISSIIQFVSIIVIGSLMFIIKNKLIRRLFKILCIVGISVPSFYISTLFLDIFGVKYNLISVTNNIGFKGSIPPAVCLAVFIICFYVPLFYNGLIKESNEDYSMYLRCQGLSEFKILRNHLIPNGILGIIPSFLQSIGLSIAGATVIERVFSVPGFGYLIVNSVIERDAPMIHSTVFFLAFFIALMNIIADIINERIEGERS